MSIPPELEERIHALPDSPGVYLFQDAQGELLYVGKSVCLRDRVRSYFTSPHSQNPRTRELVSRIADFQVILTDNELEALILENNLIKQHHPRYNIRLRDGKSYPFIKVTTNEEWPRVLKTRRLEDDGARYFGPFSSVGSVDRTLKLLKKIFPYCAPKRPIDGKQKRPCFYYYISRCLGACAGLADPDEYQEVIRQVILFLEGKGDEVVEKLRRQMEEASEAMQFERAAALRDQVRDIEHVLERQKVVSAQMDDEDVIAFAREGGEACVQVFFIRRGRLIGSESFVLQGTEDAAEGQVMASFITQFYETAAQVPRTLLLQHEVEEWSVIEEWLRQKRRDKVFIRVPRRGKKRKLVELVARNAGETLEQMRIKWLSEKQRRAGALAGLREVLGLPAIPRRIEGYDISHTQGRETVGSMVVFEDGAPKRSDYRRFRIRTVEGPDDFAAMAEVLRRRFKRAQAEGEARKGWTSMPDLVLVDGGKGQVSVAQAALEEANLDIPLIGLAKKEELIYRPGVREPLVLPRDSMALHLLQRLRDEAHRFAITYHRKRRGRAGLRSRLDEIPGIGPQRKVTLLKEFGSVRGIREASVEELTAVPGIGPMLAREIKECL